MQPTLCVLKNAPRLQPFEKTKKALIILAITARTLVVHGDRDNFFPVEIAVSIYSSIPDAALWIIPNGDHVPIYDSLVPLTSTALRFHHESDSKWQSITKQGTQRTSKQQTEEAGLVTFASYASLAEVLTMSCSTSFSSTPGWKNCIGR